VNEPNVSSFDCETNFYVFEVETLNNVFGVSSTSPSCAKCLDPHCDRCFDAFAASCFGKFLLFFFKIFSIFFYFIFQFFFHFFNIFFLIQECKPSYYLHNSICYSTCPANFISWQGKCIPEECSTHPFPLVYTSSYTPQALGFSNSITVSSLGAPALASSFLYG
jgi:hypothetical protein